MIYPRLVLFVILASAVIKTIQGSCYERSIMKNEDDLKKIIKCSYLGVPLTISSDFDGKIILPVLDETHSVITITGDKITEIILEKLSRARELNIIDVPNLQRLQIPNVLKLDKLVIKNVGGIIALNFINGFEKSNYIEISNCSIKSIDGLLIDKIENLKLISVSGITRLELPLLSFIEGTIEIRNLSDLEAIDLPKLTSIENDAIFSSIPSAVISLSILEKVKSKLVFNEVREVLIPNLREVGELTYENVASKILKLQNLNYVESHLRINNNENLIELDFPLLKEIKQIGLTVEANNRLTEISIPDLMYTRALKINSPKLTTIKYNAGLSGSAYNVEALFDCEKLKNTAFHIKICKNLDEHNNLKTLSGSKDVNLKPTEQESLSSNFSIKNQKPQEQSGTDTNGSSVIDFYNFHATTSNHFTIAPSFHLFILIMIFLTY